jgi:signal peptidase I
MPRRVPLFLTIALLCCAAALLVARPWLVHGGSMEPAVPDGSVVVVDDLGPEVAGYHRGDIVVLSTPSTAPDVGLPFMLKRVVAVPGEHVQIAAGRVFINGAPLQEPYLTGAELAGVPPDERVDVVVPNGDVFVLGDNRGHSRDSKAFGPVPVGALQGRVWLIVGPHEVALPQGAPPTDTAVVRP